MEKYEVIKHRSFDILFQYVINTNEVLLVGDTEYKQIQVEFPVKNLDSFELWGMGWECVNANTYRFKLADNKEAEQYLQFVDILNNNNKRGI